MSAVEKTIARMLATQALYSDDITDDEEIDIMEFAKIDLGLEENAKADIKFFQKITNGAKENKSEIDPIIEKYLESGRTLAKMSPVLLSILRAAIFELKFVEKVPGSVIINEYVNITGSFFDENDSGEIGFINAILDRAARELRPAS